MKLVRFHHSDVIQVDKLKTELEEKSKNKDSLEARATEAENKLTELNLKLENVSFFFFLINLIFVSSWQI